jgi:hypothetical protein
MDKKETTIIDELIKDLNVDLSDKAVDILITLSDNKGYTKLELEDIIKKPEKKGSYVYELLGELSSENFGDLTDSYSIQSYHIKDPLSLAHKIHDQRDMVSKYIFKHMNEYWMKDLSNPNSSTIEIVLPIGLNELLDDANLYNKERFREVKLSKDAEELIKRKEELKERKIRILNRVLIADAYPNEIYKTKISLIHKSSRGRYESSRDRYFINLDIRVFKFIVEHLKDEIMLDRNELNLLEIKYKKNMKILGEYARKLDSPELQKLIKHGKYDITFFTNRYGRRISNLWKFMTSNYVRELNDKYGNNEILMIVYGLPSNEFDWMKYLYIFGEKKLILEEEINRSEKESD